MAKTDCILTEFPGEKLSDIMKKQPPWFQALIRTLLARLRRADNALALYK
jgi:CRP-like cAMP-binding protein